MSKGTADIKIEVKADDINPVDLAMAFTGRRVESPLERHMRLLTLNGQFGKFASGGLVGRTVPPIIMDYDHISLMRPRGEAIWPAPKRAEPVIPALEVPDAPSEPEPVLEPESASVQLLRKLLAERRGELERFERNKKYTLEEIEDLKAQLASEEAELVDHERHISAAVASIDQVLADIKALGGRDEPTPEA